MKLTQRQLDRIEDQADNIQNAADEQRHRLNGNGAFVGESALNVFAVVENLNNVPKNKVRSLRKALERAENALQMAALRAEEISMWAQDQDGE